MRRSSLRMSVVFAVLVPGCATTLRKPAFVIPPVSQVAAIHINRINSDDSMGGFHDAWMDEFYPVPRKPVIEERLAIEQFMELLPREYRAWRPPLGTESSGIYFIDIVSRDGSSLPLHLSGNELVEWSSRQARTLTDQELHQLERSLGIEPPPRSAR